MMPTKIKVLPVHQLKIKYLLHNRRDLTDWEEELISGIKKNPYLTLLQLSKLNEIYEGLRRGWQGIKLFLDETWQDVHDFDR